MLGGGSLGAYQQKRVLLGRVCRRARFFGCAAPLPLDVQRVCLWMCGVFVRDRCIYFCCRQQPAAFNVTSAFPAFPVAQKRVCERAHWHRCLCALRCLGSLLWRPTQLLVCTAVHVCMGGSAAYFARHKGAARVCLLTGGTATAASAELCGLRTAALWERLCEVYGFHLMWCACCQGVGCKAECHCAPLDCHWQCLLVIPLHAHAQQ